MQGERRADARRMSSDAARRQRTDEGASMRGGGNARPISHYTFPL